MSELVVMGFKGDKSRASDALDKLRELDFKWVIDLEGAVAMYRDNDSALHLRQSPELTKGEGLAWGSIWGSLIGAILAVPFTGGASAAAAAALATGALAGSAVGGTVGVLDASWWKKDFGLDGTFIQEVGALLRPGDSAIFALIDTSDPDAVAAEFSGYGGTVLRSSLTSAQVAALENYLRDHTAAAEGLLPTPNHASR